MRNAPSAWNHGRQTYYTRSHAAAVAVCGAILLTACGATTPTLEQAAVGSALGDRVIVADEPQAALIGRRILTNGGNAVDAVTAASLALAVTLPSRVGLGGGGVCIVHEGIPDDDDAAENPAEALPRVRVIEFPAPAWADTGVAIPSMARGLFAFHAAYGVQRWQTVVTAAEELARFGFPVSEALLTDAASLPASAEGTALAALVRDGAGQPRLSGDIVDQPALAATLAQIRVGGAGGLHIGPLARRLTADFAGTEGNADAAVAALRDHLPRWREADALDTVEAGADMLVFTDRETAAAWSAGQSSGASGLPGALVIAISPNHVAAACAFSMGAPFGTGIVGTTTGIVGAQVAPPPAGMLALLTNAPTSVVRYVGGATGSRDALVGPLRALIDGSAAVSQALAAPRAGAGNEGRGSAAVCTWSDRRQPACTGAVDPRSRGLALTSEG